MLVPVLNAISFKYVSFFFYTLLLRFVIVLLILFLFMIIIIVLSVRIFLTSEDVSWLVL